MNCLSNKNLIQKAYYKVLMRQAFWKTFRHTLAPLGIICHYLFSRSAQDQPSYHLVGASWALPKSSSLGHLFHCRMLLFSASLQEDHFPWVWSQNGRQLPLIPTPAPYCSQEPQKTENAPHGYTGEPGHPSGNVTAAVSQSGRLWL